MSEENAVKAKPIFLDATEEEQGIKKTRKKTKSKKSMHVVNERETTHHSRMSVECDAYLKEYVKKTGQSMSYLINRCVEKVREKDMLRGTDPYVPAKVLRAKAMVDKWNQEGLVVNTPVRKRKA